MSLAGVRSNRGDSYQTLIAMRWALTILSDPEYQWLEVDSTRWLVDDVVVGRVDGSIICCQCKKNQPDFKPWTVADLADELDKASRLLAATPKAEIRFYSRNTFGLVAKLREHSVTQPDEGSYRKSLTVEHTGTDTALAAAFNSAVSLSTYELLSRTTFHGTAEFSDVEEEQLERLRFLATNARNAYNALWRRIDQLGSRMPASGSESMSVQHRLTKDDLIALLRKSGSMLAPDMEQSEIRASLSEVSVVGRAWRREIAGRRMPARVIDDLLSAVDEKKRSILLTGLPGSGKTCVLLAVQEALELRAQSDSRLVPLFIQSREFADLATAKDRQAQGLHEEWVEKVARLADDAHVVVVIDSLDVLSISREHGALTYFLAQIDRLLLVANVTVLTACRDFDRRYDRRISERVWDCELKCQPLDWDGELLPFMQSLDIDVARIDHPTRVLLQNPRELALFVELAQLEGGFSVVTSQALAQRYLDALVRADVKLGDAAMKAIESVADEMLKSRSLTIPVQRFSESPSVMRVLLSHNVLYEVQDGRIGFGHQTLLDVLVISSAIRKGMTLNDFIQSLSPAPFVRPSIRSFVAQLASGDRRAFRAQLRAVLMGSCAFHVRRLVAESFAEGLPHDDDWSLIRDLRRDFLDVFQVIYLQAKAIEWNQFWFKYLVPALRDDRDQEGLMAHLHRSSAWVNQEPSMVLPFWKELLEADWMDRGPVAERLSFSLSDVEPVHADRMGSLVELLLRMPVQEHSFLGRSIARCIDAGVMSDEVLWQFVIGDVGPDDVLDLHRLGSKLRCRDHEFGDHHDSFLVARMKESSKLLDLALQSIEDWSRARISAIGGWAAESYGFLRSTSYNTVRSQHDYQYVEPDNLLMNAIEAAVLNHASLDSDWWRDNRERLCFSHEGALRYFGILSCKGFSGCNADLVLRLLCDSPLADSEFLYELGCLTKSAFVHFDVGQQEAAMAAIFAIKGDKGLDEHEALWRRRAQARLIACIPCHLRPIEAHQLLDDVLEREGVLIDTPPIRSWGGMVAAPFSYLVFLEVSNLGVLRLLKHYTGYERAFEDHLIGGESEVASELREAASRDPERFLRILHESWSEISSDFCDAIMGGVGNYLAHIHGNLQSSTSWAPVVEIDSPLLVGRIIDELERNAGYWKQNRAASNALNACAHVIRSSQDAARLVGLVSEFFEMQEEASISGDGVGPLEVGINMARGHVVEALVIVLCNFYEHGVTLPNTLLPLLRRFSDDGNPAINAVIIRRLAYLQSQDPDVGWDLFERCMQGSTLGLWGIAEPCLYYAYYNQFERVSFWLERIRLEGAGKDLEIWGRISALAALSDRLDFSELLNDLTSINDSAAWHGASVVWACAQNFNRHRAQCVAGLEHGLSSGPHSAVVAERMSQLFRSEAAAVPSGLVRSYFASRVAGSKRASAHIYGLGEWLSATAQRDPGEALTIMELYLAYVRDGEEHIYDYGGNLTQLLTRLFAEAEEWEETDKGLMLRRVVAVQDGLLSLGVTGVSDWLKAAERP